MAFLVDGHNLIPKVAGLSLAQMDDEIALIEILQQYCRQYRCNAEVYFDGAPPGYDHSERFGRVTAHYVRQGLTADRAIISRLISLKRGAQNWVVVSSDRQVKSESRSLGARVLSGEKFATMLAARQKQPDDQAPAEKTNGLSEADDLDEWMRLFGGI